LASGMKIDISFDMDKIHLFDIESQIRLDIIAKEKIDND